MNELSQFSEIDGFKLENVDKLERVIFGAMGRGGSLEGGLGEEAAPDLVLAHYDKIGGYITKEGFKVKNGSFWDVKAKAPHKKPNVTFLHNDSGDVVEFDDPKNLGKILGDAALKRAKKEAVVKEKKSKSKFKEDKGE